MPARRLSIPILLLASLSSSCAWFRPRPPDYPALMLESGLVVHDLVVPEGGPAAAEGDTVTLEYQVTLDDGTLVDSSLEHGQRLVFCIGEDAVPVGVQEGVLGMRLFGRRELIVPPHLGYGEEGMPPDIPANATLRFEIELMAIEPSP